MKCSMKCINHPGSKASLECPNCKPFWQRMRDEGFWVDDDGWTEKGLIELKRKG